MSLRSRRGRYCDALLGGALLPLISAHDPEAPNAPPGNFPCKMGPYSITGRSEGVVYGTILCVHILPKAPIRGTLRFARASARAANAAVGAAARPLLHARHRPPAGAGTPAAGATPGTVLPRIAYWDIRKGSVTPMVQRALGLRQAVRHDPTRPAEDGRLAEQARAQRLELGRVVPPLRLARLETPLLSALVHEVEAVMVQESGEWLALMRYVRIEAA